MQEEATKKTLAISFKAVLITGEVLQSVIKLFLERKAKGLPAKKLSLRSLAKQAGKLSNIEIKANTIKEFNQIAKKFHVTYSVMKNGKENDGIKNYIIFFRADDVDRINMAFQKYAKCKLEHKPSIMEKLKRAREATQEYMKNRVHIPKREKGAEH